MDNTKNLRNMGLKATYPRLKILELFQSGEHRHLTAEDVYRLLDAAGEHHDHLVCLDCGHIEEFFDATIEARQREIAQERGFEVADHAMYLYAHCRR